MNTRQYISVFIFTSLIFAQYTVAEEISTVIDAPSPDNSSTTNDAPKVHQAVVVTATRTTTTTAQTLAPVTLITRADIENSQAQTLPDLLQGLPGIDLTTQGGAGKTASLFLRGSNTGHTLYLLNGVRIGSATLGTTAIEHIPLEQIDHIEIVRGPRSGLYGSEAIGGVIQIFTRKGTDTTRVTANAGYGTYSTRELDAGIQGKMADGKYNLHVASSKTDGINILDNSNPDKDGYENQSISAGYDYSIGDVADINLTVFHSDAENNIDTTDGDSPDLNASDDINTSDSTQNILAAGIKLYTLDNLDNTLHLSQQRDESDNFTNGSSSGQFKTQRQQLTWQGDYHFSEKNIFTLGAERLAEEINTPTAYAESERDNRALFTQTQNTVAAHDFVLALRHDNNDAIGHHNTGNVDWRWNFARNASFGAAYGRAFKAPTFNDLYWPNDGFSFGNPNLLPEQSRSTEISLRIVENASQFGLNVYRSQIENLIDWAPVDPNDPFSPWTPSNINSVTIEGIETEVATHIAAWHINANLNLSDPRDAQTNLVLQRRARMLARLDLDRELGKTGIGISLIAAGQRYSDAANTIELPGYGLLNLRASYALNKALTLKGKLDNALDREYETVQGYNNPERSVFVSLSYHLD